MTENNYFYFRTEMPDEDMFDLGGGTFGGYPNNSRSFFFRHLLMYRAIPMPMTMATMSRIMPIMRTISFISRPKKLIRK